MPIWLDSIYLPCGMFVFITVEPSLVFTALIKYLTHWTRILKEKKRSENTDYHC